LTLQAAVRAGTEQKQNLKRVNTQPKKGYFYAVEKVPTTIQPTPYVDLL
jgi:hypothetical protein